MIQKDKDFKTLFEFYNNFTANFVDKLYALCLIATFYERYANYANTVIDSIKKIEPNNDNNLENKIMTNKIMTLFMETFTKVVNSDVNVNNANKNWHINSELFSGIHCTKSQYQYPWETYVSLKKIASSINKVYVSSFVNKYKNDVSKKNKNYLENSEYIKAIASEIANCGVIAENIEEEKDDENNINNEN